MDNLEKFNSERLDSCEMKQVQGGDWLDDVLQVVEKLEPIIDVIIPG
ncbi:hypothetical protein [Flavobacterium branchiicola]|uniref:Bacteriocin-like protein n=1 Tax=Flavobacterium branchiicola TaxID=1114875 RepID=A0ABV9PBN4_9FLAO|nr:hypothetical protein [Flavobacterium branchiicola]MBS7252687.1 hypothetical protein [Flavobacterium branchiicola]